MEINNRKTVFISGIVTGTTDYRKRFAEAEKLINEIPGYIAINPIRVHDGIPEGAPYEMYMEVSFALLDYCDCIYMMPEWKYSPGARQERAFAERHHLKVFENLEDLR